MSFSPSATLKPTKLVAHIDDKNLSDFQTLLELSQIRLPTYENTMRLDGQFGNGRRWLMSMKDTWLNKYDWRKTEDRISSFSNYTVPINAQDDDTYTGQFLVLLSENSQAVPFCLLHGWPGSFIGFLSFLDVAKSKYSQKDSPYHFVIPLLPGYVYCSGPSVKKE